MTVHNGHQDFIIIGLRDPPVFFGDCLALLFNEIFRTVDYK